MVNTIIYGFAQSEPISTAPTKVTKSNRKLNKLAQSLEYICTQEISQIIISYTIIDLVQKNLQYKLYKFFLFSHRVQIENINFVSLL